ncbi:MAG TPA: hypothetical protein VFB45_06605 [Pseudolabrys sp.]|nr:hypothetical protein [Pseudolabrys sp.]
MRAASALSVSVLVLMSISVAQAATKPDAKKPASGPAPTINKLSPDAIKTTFFTGTPFTASTPAGVKFKMVFTPDGKATREPLGKSGAKGEGSWTLDKRGFCTSWTGSKANCYSLVANGENKWSVMNGPALLGIWSK